MQTPIESVSGPAVPLLINHVDTDQILPARFMRRPRKAGYGDALFYDLRRNTDGELRNELALNWVVNEGAPIIVAGANFGCGSSREAAVYALVDAGVRCVIATSFGEIFRTNCCRNGVLPVVLAGEDIHALAAGATPHATCWLEVDLRQQVVRAQGREYQFTIEPFWKQCLLEGLDDLDITLGYVDQIDEFTTRHVAEHPWCWTGGPLSGEALGDRAG